MGKSTIWPCSIAFCMFTRGYKLPTKIQHVLTAASAADSMNLEGQHDIIAMSLLLHPSFGQINPMPLPIISYPINL